MITKAMITSIDYTTNNCMVRVPLFESAGGKEVILRATFSVVPGTSNSYNTGDVVFIAFENNELGYPVVIGKLFTTAAKVQPVGAISCESLAVSKNAELPADTALVYNYDENTITNSNSYSSYHTIKDIITAINTLEANTADLNIIRNGNNFNKYDQIIGMQIIGQKTKKIYKKSIIMSPTSETGDRTYKLCTWDKINNIIKIDITANYTENDITTIIKPNVSFISKAENIGYSLFIDFSKIEDKIEDKYTFYIMIEYTKEE